MPDSLSLEDLISYMAAIASDKRLAPDEKKDLLMAAREEIDQRYGYKTWQTN